MDGTDWDLLYLCFLFCGGGVFFFPAVEALRMRHHAVVVVTSSRRRRRRRSFSFAFVSRRRRRRLLYTILPPRPGPCARSLLVHPLDLRRRPPMTEAHATWCDVVRFMKRDPSFLSGSEKLEIEF